MDPVGEGADGGNWESSTDIQTFSCVNRQLSEAAVQHMELSSALCADPEGRGEGGVRGLRGRAYIYICIADLLCCAAETNMTL